MKQVMLYTAETGGESGYCQTQQWWSSLMSVLMWELLTHHRPVGVRSFNYSHLSSYLHHYRPSAQEDRLRLNLQSGRQVIGSAA